MITIEQIEEYSCNTYTTTIEDVKGKETNAEANAARKLISYLLFRFTRMTSREIAEHYELKEQSVVDAFKNIRTELSCNSDIRRVVRTFEKETIKI